MRKVFIIMCIAAAAACTSGASRSGQRQPSRTQDLSPSKHRWRAHKIIMNHDSSEYISLPATFPVTVDTIFRPGDTVLLDNNNLFVIDLKQ